VDVVSRSSGYTERKFSNLACRHK